MYLYQNHPKFECLPPRPESGVPEPEDDLTPDAEEDIEPTIADSDAGEDEDAEADEEEAPRKQKRSREAANLEEGTSSHFVAPSEQLKMVEPLAMRAPIPEADERASKKKKVPIFGAILSSG